MIRSEIESVFKKCNKAENPAFKRLGKTFRMEMMVAEDLNWESGHE
jgi:hypothetical protein